MSIRRRLVAAFGVTLAVVLVAIGALVVARFAAERNRAIDAELRSRLAAITPSTPATSPRALVDLLGSSDEHFGQVLAEDGTVLARSRSLPDRPIVADAVLGLRTTSVRTLAERRHVRVLVGRHGGRTIVLATALDDRDDAIRSLTVLLWIGGAGSLVAASLLAWILAGAALRPVERMRAEAATHTTGDLTGRLAVPAAHDELRRLAETLNLMLEGIEDRFAEQRDFIDHASHELRTPLANLTMELELALRHDRSPDELRGAVESASQEAHRLNKLASDLLLLSRATSPDLVLDERPTDLGELVHSTIATFEAAANFEGITLVEDLPTIEPVRVDPTTIRQALTNLLANALRAAPAGGTVTTQLGATPTEVRLAVSDDGPGFSPEVRAHAFDLFARGPGARRPGAGAGLGLGIVAAVANAHGGRAQIEDQGPGATVSITLPRSPS